MKSATRYIAEDGTEFRSEADCISHEALCAEIAEVMSTLPARPDDDGCNFSNGGGYIQHSPAAFYTAREALLRMAGRIFPHKWFEQSIADKSIHPSWAGWMIDEASAPLSRAWYRFMCVDADLREWGQPFFRDHPDEAKQVCLSP
jgi:hypothetical protein